MEKLLPGRRRTANVSQLGSTGLKLGDLMPETDGTIEFGHKKTDWGESVCLRICRRLGRIEKWNLSLRFHSYAVLVSPSTNTCIELETAEGVASQDVDK